MRVIDHVLDRHVNIRKTSEGGGQILLHAGKTYTLTGPEALSNQQIAKILSAALGREVRYVDLPPEQRNKRLWEPEFRSGTQEPSLNLETLYREGGASMVTGEVALVLGRQAVSYEQFIADFAVKLR